MIHHRTKAEVRRFDLFKLAVAIILIVLLIWPLLARQRNDEMAETAVETTNAETGEMTETAVPEPAPTEPEPVMPPTFQMPDGELRPARQLLSPAWANRERQLKWRLTAQTSAALSSQIMAPGRCR